MDITEPQRPVTFLTELDKSGALLGPVATNVLINAMVDFARHYHEVVTRDEYNIGMRSETPAQREKRIFTHDLKII